jgi:predicted PurR-regulated permease PerM
MALPVNKQIQYWGIAAVAFGLVLWIFGDVLTPFVIGGALAYLFDPVADRLERAGLSRTAATAIIAVGASLLFTVIALLVIPALISQMIDLVNVMPEMLSQFRTFVNDQFPSVADEKSSARQILASFGETAREQGVKLLNTALESALSLINVIVLLVIVPVVAVYLLLDWDRMIAAIDDLLPRDHAPTIRRLAAEMDKTMAGFIRGMGTVCLILGSYYAISLMLVGLNFGLIVGAIAGLITFIPYLGALIGGALAIGLAIFQFWGDPVSIGLVAVIFVIGQFCEGNFLTPKLVGSSVGLHPVWLLLALSIFGSVFGFVGMLVAVPAAAMIGVLVRFAVEQYQIGRLYQGLDWAAGASEDETGESGS